jgi:hypothetical protein
MLFTLRPFCVRASAFCGVATADRTAGPALALSIKADDRDGGGAMFRVRLPLAQPEVG